MVTPSNIVTIVRLQIEGIVHLSRNVIGLCMTDGHDYLDLKVDFFLLLEKFNKTLHFSSALSALF